MPIEKPPIELSDRQMSLIDAYRPDGFLIFLEEVDIVGDLPSSDFYGVSNETLMYAWLMPDKIKIVG